ncbi:unnamed protein product [Clavelina lepadiformis]|uniref:Uncharacterized protein n=1 Tax=Clavelina lepadiformis TaxID=159417 RepID=A0ABP0FGE2_CLALP
MESLSIVFIDFFILFWWRILDKDPLIDDYNYRWIQRRRFLLKAPAFGLPPRTSLITSYVGINSLILTQRSVWPHFCALWYKIFPGSAIYTWNLIVPPTICEISF